MCAYSLHTVASRPANAGDQLITTSFEGTTSSGFCATDKPSVAVCLLSGTELVFAQEPERNALLRSLLLRLGIGRIGSTLARLRKVNATYQAAHRDALEFPNGKMVYVTSRRKGQNATVLQLPVAVDAKSTPTAAWSRSTDRMQA